MRLINDDSFREITAQDLMRTVYQRVSQAEE